MRTRSKSYPFNSTATIPRRLNRRRVPNIFEPEIRTIEEVVPMADRTMEELIQTPTEGYGEAIVILEILAKIFYIKTNLLQLVQSNKFHIEKTCVTCGGAHAYIATDSNQPSVCVATGSYNQGELKVVTTRSSLAYEGLSIPTNSPLEKVVKQNTKETTDKEHSNCQGSSAQVQPPVVPISISEPDVPSTQPKPTIPYSSRLNDQKLREKATNQMENFFQIFHDLHFDISFAVALLLMPKFASTIKSLLMNKDKLFELPKVPLNENCSAMLLKKLPEKLGNPDVIDISYEEFVQNVLDFQYNPRSSNPTLVFDPLISESDFSKKPIVKSSSPTLTPFRERDFFLEEIKDFLNDDSIPTRIDNSFYDPEGDILFLEKLLNEDPFQLPPMDIKHVEETKAKSSIGEPPELELKEITSHLEYAFLEDSNKLPAIAWKISDTKGIDPRFCTHKILMEDDYKPAVQSQRRVNPKIHDVIKKEVIKLLDADMIYPISDSPWVSPIHCVPKKGGYFQIPIDPQDQEKTTFTCPYGTFAYRRMPFGLCNAPVTGDIFSSCLTNLDKMLERCEETNLVLNWEKCHFMCREGIVLGHKISKSGIEVDRAKVDTHDSSPGKGDTFYVSKECVDEFDTLKKKLTEASILVVPDWNLPFELICDASDFAIGAVLGQRKTKHFQPIHYASKTMTEAQIHYTTTEKEILVVVYAFEKFQPYIVLSRSIVYTDHSTLKYLLNKQDAKLRLLRWVLLLQ
nr:hypothetical protein [Tanacetum cinerariifolium]